MCYIAVYYIIFIAQFDRQELDVIRQKRESKKGKITKERKEEERKGKKRKEEGRQEGRNTILLLIRRSR